MTFPFRGETKSASVANNIHEGDILESHIDNGYWQQNRVNDAPLNPTGK